MKFTDFLQIVFFSITTGYLINHEWSIPWAILIGFLSSFLPLFPGALSKGAKAFMEEWNDPKYTKNK